MSRRSAPHEDQMPYPLSCQTEITSNTTKILCDTPPLRILPPPHPAKCGSHERRTISITYPNVHVHHALEGLVVGVEADVSHDPVIQLALRHHPLRAGRRQEVEEELRVRLVSLRSREMGRERSREGEVHQASETITRGRKQSGQATNSRR